MGGSGDTNSAAASTDNTASTGGPDSGSSSDNGNVDASDDNGNVDASGDSGSSDAATAQHAVKVKAKKIIKEFEDNEAAADTKYKGKTLRVTGVVAKVDTEMFDDSQYIIELNGGGQWDILTVNCNDVSEAVGAKGA
jgi:hypothetical protein